MWYLQTPTLVHNIMGDGTVVGVVVLEDSVYIARHQTSSLEVYDAVRFKKKRCVEVSGLKRPEDMATCSHHRSLYISDSSASERGIHRVGRSIPETAVRWSVGCTPDGLSVLSTTHNLLVASREACRLKEYTTDGTLVREMCLGAMGSNLDPLHAVRLTGGGYLICNDTMQPLLGTTDDDGHVRRFYEAQSTAGHLDQPVYLIVDSRGYILVADRGNHRVLLLSPTLSLISQLVRSTHGLKSPYRLFLDEARGRLYVGNHDGQLLVFKVLKT